LSARSACGLACQHVPACGLHFQEVVWGRPGKLGTRLPSAPALVSGRVRPQLDWLKATNGSVADKPAPAGVLTSCRRQRADKRRPASARCLFALLDDLLEV
jgi:hypothetical protein